MPDKATTKRIKKLKSELKSIYLRHHYAHEGLSCGTSLGQTFRPEISELVIEFNKRAEELEKLDDTFPKGSRLLVATD